MNRQLIDTSFLYATLSPRDKYHRAALHFNQTAELAPVILDVVLTETTYLVQKYLGHQAKVLFLQTLLESDTDFETVAKLDIIRAHQIMVDYPDQTLDFVDCCLVAVAERRNIHQICTFDRRDFSIIKPKHCPYFDLLPQVIDVD